MKILVATDLSERSDRALGRAFKLHAQFNADLEILHVIDDTLPSKVAQEMAHNAKTTIADQIVDAGMDAASVTIDIRFGHDWATIVAAANDANADLVILGAHRNRGMAELFLGTTLHRVARALDRPILVVTRNPSSPYHDVVIGTDFSNSATHAAATATALVDPKAITFVNAYHIPYKGLVMQTDARGDIPAKERVHIEKALRSEMTDWMRTLPAPINTAKFELHEGGPASVLDAVVRQKNADLLALGQHSRSGFVEAFLGSTARDLMSDPPTDLLLTPAHR